MACIFSDRALHGTYADTDGGFAALCLHALVVVNCAGKFVRNFNAFYVDFSLRNFFDLSVIQSQTGVQFSILQIDPDIHFTIICLIPNPANYVFHLYRFYGDVRFLQLSG